MTDMVRLWDIYTIPLSPKEVREILFRWLEERDPISNISHRKMPSWESHCDFVNSYPYLYWWFIADGELPVGHVYVTKQHEIGIQVAKAYQGNGYATMAMNGVLEVLKGRRLLANIAPGNLASQKFFAKFGFVHIQNTFERRL